jgi:exodeoxyribonuclease VII large subunit
LLNDRLIRADRCLERQLLGERGRVARSDASLKALPARLLGHVQRERQHVGALSRQSDTAISHALSRGRAAIVAQDRVLQSLSYKNVLKRGFAVVRDEDNKPLTRAAGIGEGRAISVEFADGRIAAVTGNDPGAGDQPVMPPQPKKKAPKVETQKAETSGNPPKQGSLF